MKVALIVEGRSDELLFKDIYDWFSSKSIEVIVRSAEGKPNIFKKADKHFHSCIYGEGVDHVIFIVDLDYSTEADLISKFKINGDPSKYSIHISIKELEAWFLADGDCLSEILGTPYQPSGFTDTIDNPKEVLQLMFRKKFGFIMTEVELVKKIVQHFSLDRAAKNNCSAENFVTKLIQLSPQGSPV